MRGDTESGGSGAIKVQHHLQPLILLIAAHIPQFTLLLQPFHDTRCPGRKLIGVGGLQGKLVLRTAYSGINGKILYRLHEEGDPSNLGQFRLQAANDVGGIGVPFMQRFQVDLDSAAVKRSIGAVNSDE